MNLLQKIKTLWTLNVTVNELTKEAKKMDGNKPGWKTTEFWLNVATQVSVLWAAVRGFVPPKTAAIVEVVAVGVYTIARTALKVLADVKATKTT